MTKTFRQLQIFKWLSNGRQLTKNELVEYFKVSPRAIQRDISDLNIFLAETSSHQEVTYSAKTHCYQLISSQDELTSQDVLVIAKILLASRALNKNEMNNLLNGLLHLIKDSERKAVSPIINNERFFYQPIHHKKALVDRLWQLSQAIRHQSTLNIIYNRRDNQTVSRTILPEAIIFSEYYFYLISFNAKYDTNLLYRVDRISDITTAETTIKRERKDRVEDGHLRKRMQFMYPGKLTTVQFRFWGIVEAALDRLPTGQVIKRYTADNQIEPITNELVRNLQPETGGSVIIEAEVYGERGIMMWLLSQGSLAQVQSPNTLVNAIKKELSAMQSHYS